MKKKEIQAEINSRLSSGESKSSVFKRMSGQGASDSVVANFIASYASPELCAKHAKLIDAMVVISWLQLGLAVLVSLGLGLKMGLVGLLLIATFVGGFSYLFVWGFAHDKAWAYNATIILSIINLPKVLTGFATAPISNAIGLAVSVCFISFTWYVRSKIFPDFVFASPKKIKGRYVFTS